LIGAGEQAAIMAGEPEGSLFGVQGERNDEK
jgi:hypothetical protein